MHELVSLQPGVKSYADEGVCARQADDSEPTIVSNVALQGDVLSAEMNGQLRYAKLSSHSYLDEQVMFLTGILC